MVASLCGLRELIRRDPAPYRNLAHYFTNILKQVGWAGPALAWLGLAWAAWPARRGWLWRGGSGVALCTPGRLRCCSNFTL